VISLFKPAAPQPVTVCADCGLPLTLRRSVMRCPRVVISDVLSKFAGTRYERMRVNCGNSFGRLNSVRPGLKVCR
jgi:hypothetical protein